LVTLPWILAGALAVVATCRERWAELATLLVEAGSRHEQIGRFAAEKSA
jgi:hypothetical protein